MTNPKFRPNERVKHKLTGYVGLIYGCNWHEQHNCFMYSIVFDHVLKNQSLVVVPEELLESSLEEKKHE
jgi:hypothetical protein